MDLEPGFSITPAILSEDEVSRMLRAIERAGIGGSAGRGGIRNLLDRVPEVGALVAIGFPRLKGGTGGYASYTAICPPDWPSGISVGQVPEAPLPKSDKPLHWDPSAGTRVR